MKNILLAFFLVFAIVGSATAEDVVAVDMKMASIDDLAQTIASDPLLFLDASIEVRSVAVDSFAFQENLHPFTWPAPFFLHPNAMMLVQNEAMKGSNVQFWFKAKDGDQAAIDFVKKVKGAPAAAVKIDYLKGFVSRPRGIQNMPFVVVITDLRLEGLQYSGEFTDEFND